MGIIDQKVQKLLVFQQNEEQDMQPKKLIGLKPRQLEKLMNKQCNVCMLKIVYKSDDVVNNEIHPLSTLQNKQIAKKNAKFYYL